MSNVLLLRAPSSDGHDKYEAAFDAIAYHPVSVPVLETVLVDLPGIRKVVAEGPDAKGLGGVVVTSARSCEAWRDAVEGIVRHNPPHLADWTKVPFYVVGEATTTALSSISSIPNSHTLVPPSTNIRGADSGTGEKLAHFILSDLPQQYPDAPRKLLFLTGDKNRDVLPNILKEGGVELEPLQVYATQGSSTFAGDLEEALEKVSPDHKGKDWWVVFFAPSAAEFVLPMLRKHFDIPSVGSKTSSAKIAAIGPTTATFLRDKLALRVDVSPLKPSPEALATAIRDFQEPDASL